MDAVFFDIDDTLYDQSRPFANAVHKVCGDVPGVADNDLYLASRRHSAEVFQAFAKKTIPSDETYIRRARETMAEFGIELSDERAIRLQRAYASHNDHATRLSPTMQRMLALCATRTRMGIISNGSESRQLAKLRSLGTYEWIAPEAVFISDAVGLAKPNPALFRLACERLGVSAENSAYVGDSLSLDVAGSNAAGMTSVWFNRRYPAHEGEPIPSWTVTSEEGLLELFDRLL